MEIIVVIVNYNSSELLSRCLDCLKCQTRPADRIVVVDNNSSEPITTEQLESSSSSSSEVELIQLETNLGYGAAINAAILGLANADLLCCLNPDAFPAPTWLEEMELAALNNPTYSSFASLMLSEADPEIIDGAGDALHISGFPWRQHHGNRLDSVELKTGPVFSACAGAAMYRVTAFNVVGGFDPDYFMYVEDIDLGFRMQLADLPCLFVAEAVVLHKGSAISGADSPFAVYHGHRNLVRNYVKNMPLITLILTFPLHIAATLVSIIVVGSRGHVATVCKAKWDAMRSLNRSWQSRTSYSLSWKMHTRIWLMLDKRMMR